MKPIDAISLLINRYASALFVSTCGFISRDLFSIKDQPSNFYTLGSMGIAAPIGLGISLTLKERTTVILDGDGSFLMNLGVIAMIGELRPQNLIHAVLDNSMYESTGGQKTVSHYLSFTNLALSAGYIHAEKVASVEDFARIGSYGGPLLIHFLLEPRDKPVGKRISWSPVEIVERFSHAATGEA